MQNSWQLAIDIGGTFTDVALLNASTGNVVVAKTLTTGASPLDGVKDGCRKAWQKANIEPEEVVGAVVHATTLVTNALIEGKGVRAALVTTRGFRDTLLIRDEHRYDMYDLQIEFPPPAVSRELTFEVDERVLADGRELSQPAKSELDALVATLADASIQACAVCLLHGYANHNNEHLIAQHIQERLDIPVCVSADVAPQIREYPRMATTACNAVTMPLVNRYLEEFQSWLRQSNCGSALLIMRSNGGVVGADDAARAPIRMVESGPAAGALASAWYARRNHAPHALSFDMGGTTAKACLIEHYEPSLAPDLEVARIYRFKRGSGYPIMCPSVDLVEIGAGGGSIARVDSLKLLTVGPDSAGAEPGPACYARGGNRATVTDADLLLGYLDAGYFLGGDMALDLAAAEEAFAPIANALELSVLDAAAGVHDLVNQNMAAAARMHGIERGIDLRGIPIIAFGGAGPVHACGVAELLDAQNVLFPMNASVLSAFGTLVTPARVDLARSFIVQLSEVTDNERECLLEEMRNETRQVLSAAGINTSEVRFRYGIDARYEGQGNEVTVWVGEGARWPLSMEAVREQFIQQYEAIYGMSIPDVPIEVVTWRLSAFSPTPQVDVLAPDVATGTKASARTRRVHFQRETEDTEVFVFDRYSLHQGDVVAGPALIEEPETTIVLRPDWNAEVLDDGSLMATREVK